MKIMPAVSTYSKPAFKNYSTDGIEPRKHKPQNNNSVDYKTRDAAIACGGLLAGIGALALNCIFTIPKENNKEFIEDTFNIIQSDEIKKDTVLIKDVTDDNQPDIILFKNDGSKVIVDIANSNIIEKN